jgi:hypothetical protein
MTCYDFSEYNLIGFERGCERKKYIAKIQHKKSKKVIKIPFGDTRYQQYKDNVFGLYSHKDHFDNKRRENYQKRHKNDNLNCFSPGYFSWFYLW